MYIAEQEVRAVLTYQALIPAIRQALLDDSAGLIVQPPPASSGKRAAVESSTQSKISLRIG